MVITANAARNMAKPNDLSRLVPTVTEDQHLKRVEEWTLKSQSAPPSNIRKTAKQAENEDLEAKSRLVDEAVKLLDNRDEQIKSREARTARQFPEGNATSNGTTDDARDLYYNQKPNDDNDQNYSLGKRFRESRMTARNYVKDFESKIKRKKEIAASIMKTYPLGRSRRGFRSKILAQLEQGVNANPVLEPDTWRHRASRSVRFSVKYPTNDRATTSKAPTGVDESENDESDSKWVMKHENDRDWWKWKLRQRFMQNDELLHKLASQRLKIESSFKSDNGKNGPVIASSLTTMAPFPKQSSSRHITVEISPQKPGPSKRNNPATPPGRLKDPMPNFYSPSGNFLNNMERSGGKPISITAMNKQKLKTLRKDPYLARILAGNEMFKPEMMLEANESNKRHELSEQFKSAMTAANINSYNAKRKISLESLAESTDDEFTAAKFFNPDIKILYERMSEMAANEAKNKNKLKNLVSREPSDGFLNLPLLLATGRFNRYNKLPQMKGFNIESSNFQQNRRSDRNRSQSPGNKRQMSSTPQKTGHIGVVAQAAAALAGKVNPTNSMIPGKKLEEMTTKDWAKHLMSKMKTQSNTTGNRVDRDNRSFVTLSDEDDDVLVRKHKVDTRLFNIDEAQDAMQSSKKKYKVPVDQETNLLYHEILMSKWKKEKHEKNKDFAGGHETVAGTKTTKTKNKKGKKTTGDYSKIDRPVTKPRGLDIWLENIREKAKRDRLIAPLSNHDVHRPPVALKKVAPSQPIVTTFNNAAFTIKD